MGYFRRLQRHHLKISHDCFLSSPTRFTIYNNTLTSQRYYTASSVYFLKGTCFRDTTPCSPSKVNRSSACHLLSGWFLTSTMKMEAICSSETLVHFQRTTWLYILEDSTLHSHRCEHLKTYSKVLPVQAAEALRVARDWGSHIFRHSAHRWR
jgi:hypothetical protein